MTIMKYCPNCGSKLEDNQETCLKCGKIIRGTANTNTGYKTDKSKIAAGILGILLGAFGVHNFYLGYTGKAMAQLLLTICTFGILSWVSAIWGLVEGVLILCGSINVDASGNYLSD